MFSTIDSPQVAALPRVFPRAEQGATLRTLRALAPHLVMIAIMLPMVLWHGAAIHLAVLVVLLIVAMCLAAHTRVTGRAHTLQLVDTLVMAGLALTGAIAPVADAAVVVGGLATGGLAAGDVAAHAGHGSGGSLPLWPLDAALVACALAVHTRHIWLAGPGQRVAAVSHAGLMAAQIFVMLWWCR